MDLGHPTTSSESRVFEIFVTLSPRAKREGQDFFVILRGSKNLGDSTTSNEERGLRYLGRPETSSVARGFMHLGQPSISSEGRGLKNFGQPMIGNIFMILIMNFY